ncbi:hnt1 [Nucleospora cyclopteri]
MACLFCSLQKNNGNILFENEYFYVLPDRFPCSKTHLLFISKEHVAYMHELPPLVASKIINFIQKVVKHLQLKAYTVVNNNEYMQLIKHAHFHLISADETGNANSDSNSNFSEDEYNEYVKEFKLKMKTFES